MGVHLIGMRVYLIGVDLIGTHHRRASHRHVPYRRVCVHLIGMLIGIEFMGMRLACVS